MKRNKGFSLLELLIVVAIILMIASIAVPSLVRARQSANETGASANLRTLNIALQSYATNNQGMYGEIPELIEDGLIDDRYSGVITGYSYTVVLPDPWDYVAYATVAKEGSGKYDYYSGADMIIRYSDDESRAPAGLAGQPVR